MMNDFMKQMIKQFSGLAMIIGGFLLIFANSAAAQTKPTKADYPKLSATGAKIDDFVPQGWKIIQQKEGDLNGDKLDDAVLVLKGTDPKFINKSEPLFGEAVTDEKTGETKFIMDSNPRILAVLLKEKNGYKLAAQNDSIIPFLDYPSGETIRSIAVENGDLNIELMFMERRHGYLYTEKFYKFRFAGSAIALVNAKRIDTSRYEKNVVEEREYDFLNRKVNVKQTSFSDKKLLSDKKRNFKTDKSKTLQELVENWEIEKGYFL